DPHNSRPLAALATENILHSERRQPVSTLALKPSDYIIHVRRNDFMAFREYLPRLAAQLVDAPVVSGLKTATPPAGTPSSYATTISSGIGAKSATRRKSRNDVPVEALSLF